MSRDYIRWDSLSDGEKENLRKSVCEKLLERSDVASHFRMVKEKYSSKAIYCLESKHEDSTAKVVVHETEQWPEKAGVFVKKSDGYGNGNTRTIRYVLKEDQSFNEDKLAAKLLELNEESIDHAKRRRDNKAHQDHSRELKRMIEQELKLLLVDEPWEVKDYWDSVRIQPKGDGYEPCLEVKVSSYHAPDLKWAFKLTGDAAANAKLMKAIADLTQVVSTVIESSEFQFASLRDPVSA